MADQFESARIGTRCKTRADWRSTILRSLVSLLVIAICLFVGRNQAKSARGEVEQDTAAQQAVESTANANQSIEEPKEPSWLSEIPAEQARRYELAFHFCMADLLLEFSKERPAYEVTRSALHPLFGRVGIALRKQYPRDEQAKEYFRYRVALAQHMLDQASDEEIAEVRDNYRNTNSFARLTYMLRFPRSSSAEALPEEAEATRAQIKIFDFAVKKYKLDMRQPPTTLEDLIVEPSTTNSSGRSRWRGPYLETVMLPMDGWGNPYQMEFTEEGKLVIFSSGPDGKVGNEDDITHADDR